MTQQDSQTFQDRARSAIRAAGMRWTKQRETLLDVIEHAREHLDADGLYRLARERDPRLSLATVYRTLGVLKRQGLVDELHLSEEHHHYEASSDDQHFHFVCTSCGAVTEFSASTVDRLRKELQREHGVVVQSVDLDLAGLCAKCAAA
ncbi:MAG TPA: Fur family transcriptional regulator [Chloroflexota bacterium]|nr:Fur family transcriptional regulator [Chloroflexota bacterium]